MVQMIVIQDILPLKVPRPTIRGPLIIIRVTQDHVIPTNTNDSSHKQTKTIDAMAQ